MALVAVLAASGCEREPLPWICPEAAAGELVITELRGDQSTSDTYGQWVELYNASGRELDLEGLQITITRLDGGGTGDVLVRTRGVTVGAGDHVVLGAFEAAAPAHVDYGWLPDFDQSFYDSGAVDLWACDTRVDRVVYRDLPSTGTWSLDGDLSPSAEANDDDSAWCVDDVEDPDETTELGVRGTPGEANRSCSP